MGQRATQHPLKTWRLAHCLTLDAAAAQVGTTRPVWWCWENGRYRPSARFMSKIRDLTGGVLSADDFFHSIDKAA
jgi:transcriptional regulator with XRE-family HTH domain